MDSYIEEFKKKGAKIDEIIEVEDQLLIAQIFDAEIDVLQLEFVDGGVNINTANLSYIALNMKTLNNLQRLLKCADEKYEEMDFE